MELVALSFVLFIVPENYEVKRLMVWKFKKVIVKNKIRCICLEFSQCGGAGLNRWPTAIENLK